MNGTITIKLRTAASIPHQFDTSSRWVWPLVGWVKSWTNFPHTLFFQRTPDRRHDFENMGHIYYDSQRSDPEFTWSQDIHLFPSTYMEVIIFLRSTKWWLNVARKSSLLVPENMFCHLKKAHASAHAESRWSGKQCLLWRHLLWRSGYRVLENGRNISRLNPSLSPYRPVSPT